MTQLTPIEIERHEFKTIWRGYDPAEVRAFLGQIANQLTALTRDQERVAEELEIKAQRLHQVDDYETRLRDALLAATQLGEHNREEARREAELILKEAELKADQLLFDGRQAHQSLVHEIEALRRQRERLSVELRAVIESHLRTLENQEEYLKSAQQEPRGESWRDWERPSRADQAERSRLNIDGNAETLSSARELTVTLASNLNDDEMSSSDAHATLTSNPSSAQLTPPLRAESFARSRAEVSKRDKGRQELQAPVLTPSLPQPLTTRPLTGALTETPAVASPAVVSPAVVSPAVASPAVASPAVVSPAVASPAVASPAVASPAVASPAVASPAVVSPAVVSPAVISPAVVSPAVVSPAVVSPAVVSPAVVSPAVVSPAVVSPAVVSPAVVSPAVVSLQWCLPRPLLYLLQSLP